MYSIPIYRTFVLFARSVARIGTQLISCGYNSPVQLYFIRHGQSQNNALYATTGSSDGRSHDPELTPLGHQQAQKVAEYLRQPDIYQPSDLVQRRTGLDPDPASTGQPRLTHLYCSLMVRAVATAMPISRSLNLPATAFVDLHEAGGIYLDQPQPDPEAPGAVRYVPVGMPGNNRAYFEQHYPGLLLPADLDERGWWNRPYEVMEERSARARRVLQELIERHGAIHSDRSEDRVGLVSHGGFYNHFLRSLLGLPPRRSDEELAEIWFHINNTAVTRIDYIDGYFTILYMNDTHHLPPEWVT